MTPTDMLPPVKYFTAVLILHSLLCTWVFYDHQFEGFYSLVVGMSLIVILLVVSKWRRKRTSLSSFDDSNVGLVDERREQLVLHEIIN